MAVTKIHGIKTTVDKAIEYICNPDKTDQNLYISSFACSPETAVLDFKYTLDHTHDCRDPHNTNKAFHLIQAFSPGEVSYEEAHQIGNMFSLMLPLASVILSIISIFFTFIASTLLILYSIYHLPFDFFLLQVI